ncbi:MAG: peroxidase family protein [Cyanobacteria bacterium P01_D01_bin.115]
MKNADVVVLDADQDGVGQITELLTQYQDLTSLQILSHGDAGQLNLGSGVLNAETITRYADELTQWQSALNDEADILLYGCNVAAGAAGQAFVTQLHQLTGADIAASTDLTGTAALGGDWQLEYTQGQIETELAVEASVLETYGATLVTPIRYEVEDWSLKDFKAESWSFASNQQTVRLTANSGTATTTFNEVDGLYEVKIGYFDENDGEADATLTIGSQSFSWQFDKAFPGTVPTDKNDTFVEWQPPLELKQGDLIELVANKNLEEYARIDYVEFTLIEEPGTLSFANATYQVDEGTNELLVTVERTGGNTGEVSADITVTGGDAQTGPLIGDVDLTFPTTVTLADGVMQQTLVIPIVDDTLDESTETLELSLASPTNGATLGSQDSTVISILDNDDPAPPVGPTIRSEVENWDLTNFDRETQSLASNQETIRITADDGSATTNFTGAEGRYTIKVGFFDEVDGIVDARFEINGQLLKTWQFDSQIGGNVPTAQNFREITLETNVLLRPNDVLTIFADQDVEEYARIDYVEFVPAGTAPTPGTLAFADATYQVNEGTNELVVTVERTGGSAGEVSADITVTGGDAQTGTASDDVNLAFPITVTLADGVLQQTFTLPIVDDSIDETTETLELSLSSPTNGATLGGVSSTTISIVDNDPVLPGGDPIRSEVEDWTLTNFEREARSFASNQETIRIPSKDLTGSATTTFNGPSGQYLIEVGFFDEVDGVVDAQFEINGQVISTWQFDSQIGGGGPTEQNFREVTLGTDVALTFGDVLTIVAEQDIEEYARIDYIDFTPVTTAGSLSANLVNDTGASDSDRITADATIVGNVGDVATLSTLEVQIGTATIDITSLVQPDGSFTLTPQALSEQFGYFLSDGAQILTIISTDASDNTSTVPISLTLDRAVADLSLTTPIGGGENSPYVHLLGDAPEAGTLTISVDGGSATEITLGAGEFDQLLQAQPLAAGARQLALSFTDVAGNTTQTTVDFDVTTTNFQIGGSGTQGWVARSNETIVLGESDSYVVAATQLIELGQSEGTRTLRFAVDAAFDLSDVTSASTDQLSVYLVDPNNLSQTLLDGGQPGTPVFTLAGDQAEFIAGQVRFDGQFVEIDLSSLSSLTEGLLVFQLLNQDGDDGSRVIIGEIENQVDSDGINTPIFVDNPTLAMAGGALDLGTLAVSNDVAVRFSGVRFDDATGQYTATLQLHNTSETDLGRNIAVLFANLPSGITLQDASGTDTSGNGYLNMRNAIRPGGLTAGSFSDGLEVRFSNPSQLRLALQPQVWVGGPNQAPVFDTVAPITATPGQTTTITLAATDPDGDPITYSLQGTNLPNSKLDGNGNLVFEPTPNQVGTYDFTVTASDGTTSVSQTVSLTVTPDPITTTRISGQVLDINGNPLANLPLELGRLQAVTDAQGYFTITLPDSSIPTEEINIKIPLGDPAFDPFLTGEQEINLRRTTFDGTTGTDAANPLRHPNLVTTFMDASMVYGSDATRANALRTLDGTGKLKVSAGDLLPLNSAAYFAGGPLANNNRSLNDPSELFAAGDVRANENIGLTSLHTVFMREHNRLAEDISTANPGLTGEEIYQQARKLVSAQIQHITYQEYLPLLLGQGAIATYSGYDSNIDPSISHLFSAAAFRLGHTQSFDEFLLIDGAGQNLPSVSLRESTFNPEVIQQNGIEAILRGLVAQSAEAVDLKVLDDLRNTLFGPPGSGGIDLAAVDIERGRDVGLPDYNQAREDSGLARVTSFAEITADTAVQAALEAVYGTVDNIDVIVGGLAEDKAAGAMVGELFQTIMADQFARLRDGDRFWYENSQFSQADLTFIRNIQLADLIERNTTITGLSGNIFSSSLNPTGPAAGGSAGTSSTAEYAAIDGSNNNLTDPDLGTVGTHMRVDYTQEYGDGVRTPGGAERPNTREISNALFSQDTSVPDASGATGILLAWSQFMGHDFTFSPAGAADTLKVYGDQYQDPNGGSFPFVAEKLDLMLGHEVYAGVNNVIDRPIYLPALDLVSNSQSTDAQGNVTVSNATLGASVFVENNSLEDREGNPFSGDLSITEVPTDLTPAALPEGLSPDLVVTIQPSDLVFTDPAELALPNGGGWAPGTEMDLWSINPNTGDFEIVGTGRVSADGSLVETTEGGIRNSSWHFFSPPPMATLQGLNVRFEDNACNSCAATALHSSQVNLNTGEVIETHTLPTYQSLGADRGVQLTYDSLRADARPIVQFGGALRIRDVDSAFLVAEMTVHNGNYDYQVPGSPPVPGLDGGEHFWSLPTTSGEVVNAALQADLRTFESGVYDFSLDVGVYRSEGGRLTGSSRGESGQLVHVNTINSAFGSGWGIAGVQEIVETTDGSVLIIDGDGSELLFEKDGNGYQSPAGDFSTLEKQPDGTFRRTTKDQSVYTFDAENRLVSVEDTNGNETQHVYTNGFLTKIIDPVELETTFSYAAGRLSTITDPANRTTQFEYDAAGNLSKIIDPDNTARTFEYDQAHRMTAEVDKRGNREQAFYDFAGRATHAINKTGAVTQVNSTQTQGLYRPEQTADLSQAPAVSTAAIDDATYADANGQVSQHTLDAAGQTISAADGNGSQGLTERNSDNPCDSTI